MTDTMRRTIPLHELHGLYPAFLTDSSVVADPQLILDETTPIPLRDLTRFAAGHRARLADGILADLDRWNAPGAARTSAEQLRDVSSYAVVTGQQAGIAGGPLYTFYKALGTVRLAEKLAAAHPGTAFIPVFWIEGDDHDVDEVRVVALPERDGGIKRISYDDGDTRRVSVARRALSADGIERFVAALREALGETDFTAEVVALFRTAYEAEGMTLVDGFARFLYAFLGDTPLLLLSSDNQALKGLASDILAREAAEPERLCEAVARRTDTLRAAGLPTPIDPKPGALFLQHEGERLSLDPDGGIYRLRGTETTFTRDAIAAIAASNPERLSPKVALRPIVQDAILPTAIYLGGPSETAYLLQLRDAYPLFDLERPAVGSRPFVTLVEAKVERVVEKGDADLVTLLDPAFDPVARSIDEESMRRIDEEEAEGKRMIAAAFERLLGLADGIDRSLVGSIGAGTRKSEKELEIMAARLRAALKRKAETEIKRFESAHTALLPDGKPQERSVNVLFLANRYGIDAVRRVFEEIAYVPGAMQVVRIPLR